MQQPALGVQGVQTSVSVPDRGGAFLGGVSRAGSSRSLYGPFRSGTSTGLFREHTGTSVHVQIIDLEEMDRAVLEDARVPQIDASPLRGQAADAYKRLLERDRRRLSGARIGIRQADSRRLPTIGR